MRSIPLNKKNYIRYIALVLCFGVISFTDTNSVLAEESTHTENEIEVYEENETETSTNIYDNEEKETVKDLTSTEEIEETKVLDKTEELLHEIDSVDNDEIEEKIEVEEAPTTVTSIKGEEIDINRLPKEIQEKIYFPEEGEEVLNAHLFEEDTKKTSMTTSSTSTGNYWSINPRWPLNVRNFFTQHRARAERVAKSYDLFTSVILAQAALESGWGSSSLSSKHNNYFGIKSTGYSGGSVDMPTWEWIEDSTHPDGGYAVTIEAGFRSYSSSEESFRDYAQFLKNNPSRYKGGFRDLAATPYEAINNIHTGKFVGRGGYATDPDYASKIMSIINTYNLMLVDDYPEVKYNTHIQSIGDQSWFKDGETSGTLGRRLRIESLQINLENAKNSSIEYQTNIQDQGWSNWAKNGQRSGTVGQAKRIEGIKVRLTGELAQIYDVFYRVHAEHFGWLDWAKNGEAAGTEGYDYRLEALEIQLVPKNSESNLRTSRPYRIAPTFVTYQPHVQSIGWKNWFKNGETGGTTNQSKRMEAIRIALTNKEYEGSVRYRSHVQSDGWHNWVSEGELSGTSGQSKRVEAIAIELQGELSKHYDIYYRVHSEYHGWLGWAKNGSPAGTEGLARRIEAIEIQLNPKNKAFSGRTSHSFVK